MKKIILSLVLVFSLVLFTPNSFNASELDKNSFITTNDYFEDGVHVKTTSSVSFTPASEVRNSDVGGSGSTNGSFAGYVYVSDNIDVVGISNAWATVNYNFPVYKYHKNGVHYYQIKSPTITTSSKNMTKKVTKASITNKKNKGETSYALTTTKYAYKGITYSTGSKIKVSKNY